MASSQPVFNPGALGLYNQQLGLMQGNYSKILGGYAQAQGNASSQLQGIYGGYDQAEKGVLNTLGVGNGGWGVAAPAAKQIEQSFTQTQGQNQQALISAGLGNSSLLAQSNNQANLFAGQAYAGLGAQLASTAAGYQSQFGLARQAAEMQGLGMQTNLSQSYLGDLAGYKFQPNVPLYGQYSSSPNGGGGGYGGGGGRSGSGGGAAGAVGATGAYGFGSTGLGNSYGYAGAYGGGYASGYASGYDPNNRGLGAGGRATDLNGLPIAAQDPNNNPDTMGEDV